jgi:hypothetical protein
MSMSDIHPLPVYPRKPTGADLALFKAAKERLHSELLIQPVDAVPGSPTRIISLREKLPWIADHAYVANPTVDSVEAALKWALGLTEDTRATTVIHMLKESFGEGVKEIAGTD